MARNIDISRFSKGNLPTPPVDTVGTGEDYFNNMLGKHTKNEVIELRIEDLVPYHDSNGNAQPFKMYNDDDMLSLVESIQITGVHTPIIVKKSEDNKYMIVAGHNRVEASKKAGLEVIPAIVKELSDDEAEYIMLSTNLEQRSELKPSELAKSIVSYMEVTKKLRKADKTQTLDDILTSKFNFSKRTVYKYVNLSNLTELFLDMIDNTKLPLKVGEVLSKSPKEQQTQLYSFLSKTNIENITMEQMTDIVASDFSESSLQDIFFPKKEKEEKPKKEKSKKVFGKKSEVVLQQTFENKEYSDEQIAELLELLLSEYFKEEQGQGE